MAKKRQKAKKQRFAGLISMLFCAAFLFVHNYFSSPGENGFPAEEKQEIPKLIAGRKEKIIHHEGYTVSYNPDYKIANWVAYELTAEEANSNLIKRADKFIPDPMLAENETATNEDYKQSGFDRGHLAPAGDMKWSAHAMQESFYFTNICPQNRKLNTGIWNVLENQCRKWATQHGAVLIVTGPVIENGLRQLGAHRVAIPGAFYKVVCIPDGNKPKGIGFLLENRNYVKTSLQAVAVPVDSVELVTGIDFFPSFPPEVQEKMESSSDWEY